MGSQIHGSGLKLLANHLYTLINFPLNFRRHNEEKFMRDHAQSQ
jgi:hypothetical protein